MFVQVEPAVSKNDLKKTFYKLVWPVRLVTLSLPSKSRSRAAVARRAHNPKVGGSIPPFATEKAPVVPGFFYFGRLLTPSMHAHLYRPAL